MEKQELIDALRASGLSISIQRYYASLKSGDGIIVRLEVGDEVISESFISISDFSL